MLVYLKRYGPPVFTLIIFISVAIALYGELGKYNWLEVKRSITRLADWKLWIAIPIAFASYLAASLNDYLGVRYAGRKLPLHTTTQIGFICYAISYNVGFTALGGTALRYQLYAARGLNTIEIAKVVVFECTSFFIGVCFLGGILLAVGVPALSQALQVPLLVGQLVGVALLVALLLYFAASWRRVGEISFRDWHLALPTPPLALGQMLGSLVDICLAAATMYILLPEMELSYFEFLPLFLAAMLSGLASTVPGGLGVIEAVMLVMLREQSDQAAILGGLLAYRVVYYLIPLAVGVLLLIGTTLHRRHREMLGLLNKTLDQVPALLPRVLGVATYMSGVYLLLSGVLPPDTDHVSWLRGFFPLFVSESAYVVCAVLGVGLLFVARGIQRRLAAVYRVTLLLVVLGLIFAFLRGLDYAAALVMALTLLALLGAHDTFDRERPLFSQSFGGQWFSTTLFVLGLSLLVSGIAVESQIYDGAQLWSMDWPDHAGRVIRVAVASLLAVVLLAATRLAQGRKFLAGLYCRGTAAEAKQLAEQWSREIPLDSRLLFSPGRDAVLAYKVSENTWAAQGMPVGDPQKVEELIWTFTDMAEMSGATPLFEEIPESQQKPFLKAGYIPVVYHPDTTGSDQFVEPGKIRTMTRSLIHEIKSLLHEERSKLKEVKEDSQAD